MITPSFSLDFTSAVLGPEVTFTRTTSASNPATYINSTGLLSLATNNQPRFNYDPVTLACKGLLIEESRTNLLLRSESFGTSPWIGAGITADQITAPDGNNTADLGTFTGGVNDLLYQTVAVTASTTYTFTCYVKLGTMAAGDYKIAFYNNTAASFIVTGAVPAEPLSNSVWTRISYSVTTPAGCTSMRVYAFRNPSVPANSTIYFWGAQLEAGAFATSYIPTTATALTRNADVATITGTDFSDWWQAGLGGATVQALPSTVSGIRPLIQFDDGTANEIIALRGNTTNPELYIVDGGTPQAQIDAGTIASNTNYSLTGWWATNDCKARLDSGAVVTDTSATIPTVTQAQLGSDGTNYLNGHLASISYYDSFSEQIYTRRKNKAVFNLM